MARPIINDPLAGQSPGLQPTARPLNIPIGATPPPQRSPLMELGDAFGSFNPTLRGLLRDAAAKADNDAMALGEIEATRAGAAKRMGEIEKVLKEQVDAGKLDAVRLPAFERGFRLRAGKELAQSLFQEGLTKRLNEATRVDGRVDPEQIIAETREEVSKLIHPDDFYAKAGFDEVSQGVIAGFRQRAAEGYTAEYRRAALTKIADEGSELSYQLATADDESAPALKQSIREHLDIIRKELPTSQVNGFYVENVIVPAIKKLRYERKIDEAQQLLDEAEGLDVTGNGGLLGKTNAARAQFSTLRSELDNARRTDLNQKFDELKTAADLQTLTGKNTAATQLQKLRLENNGKLPPDAQFKIIDQFRAANPNDALLVEGFASAVNQEFEHEDRYRINDRLVAEVLSSANTLSKEQLDAADIRATTLAESREIPWSVQAQVKEITGKRRALFGSIDEQDFRAFKKDVFYSPSSIGLRGATTVNFGDSASADLWEKLGATEIGQGIQNEVELATTDYFRQQLESFIVSESGGDPAKAPTIKAIALDKATLKAREFAKASLTGALKRNTDAKTAQAVAGQATAIKQASVTIPSRGLWAQLNGSMNEGRLSQAYKVKDKVAKGIKDAPESTYAFVPAAGEDLEKSIAAQKTTPQSEWDVMATPDYFYYTRQAQEVHSMPRVLDLKELAKEINATGDEHTTGAGNPGRVEAARGYYGIAKSLLGFTPDEIKAGKTKHGVTFTASEIDYKSIPVFRSVADLQKEWNGGDFTPLFGEVGDLIDPKNKVHPEDFYKAQLALLSARK